MKFFKIVLPAVLAVLLLAACGKKTEPVPVTEAVTANAENLRIYNNAEGIVIRNSDKRYVLRVRKAVFDPECGCLSDYEELTEIAPNSTYTDKDVTEETRYVYSVAALHPVYKNESEPLKKAVVYAVPVVITDISVKDMAGERYEFSLKTDKPYERFEVFSDGKLALRTSRSDFELDMDGRETRMLSIYPFDKFGNPGEEKVIRLAERKQKPRAPFGLRSVSGSGILTVSWDEPEGAWLYNVYIFRDDRYYFYTKVDVPYFMYAVGSDTGCQKIAVSTVNDGAESDKAFIEACYP
jgi:hypothetical protein